MKSSRIIIVFLVAIVVITVLGLILYFTESLKIQDVLQHTDNIETIGVSYFSNGKTSAYMLTQDQGMNFDEMIQILGSVTYTRKLNTFRGGTGDVLMLTIIYKDKNGVSNNYLVDIRELGIIIRENKEYRVNGNSKELINRVVDWIKKEGKLTREWH